MSKWNFVAMGQVGLTGGPGIATVARAIAAEPDARRSPAYGAAFLATTLTAMSMPLAAGPVTTGSWTDADRHPSIVPSGRWNLPRHEVEWCLDDG